MLKFRVLISSLLLLAAVNAQSQEQTFFPQVPGWTLALEPRVYDSNDLWDIIDGAADLYLEYAFVDLHIARYTTETKREVKVELYRHQTAEHAFGIYAAERSPELNFIPMGTQGYQQASVLNFLDGEFYLRLSSYQSDRASADDLLLIARAMEQQLNRTGAMPDALRLFPPEGKQANSEQFVAQNFLGYGFLRSVYTASYGSGTPFKAFIIESPSRADADKLLNQYFLKMPQQNITKLDKDRFDISDPNNGSVSLAIEGRSIYGTLNAADERLKYEVLSGLKKNLSHP